MRSTVVLVAVIAAIFVGGSTAQAATKHHKGCNTHQCDKRVAKKWAKKHPMQTSLASWYGDGGATASGAHYKYGVAHKTIAFKTRIRMCYQSRCVTVKVQDRGPFISGREWDLNPAAKDALRCPDLCYVRWRYAK
jgi:rare lipoprotein A (peptidoglycan hydrolase)